MGLHFIQTDVACIFPADVPLHTVFENVPQHKLAF